MTASEDNYFPGGQGPEDDQEYNLTKRLEWLDGLLSQNNMPDNVHATWRNERSLTEQQLALVIAERHAKEQVSPLVRVILWTVAAIAAAVMLTHFAHANWPSPVVL